MWLVVRVFVCKMALWAPVVALVVGVKVVVMVENREAAEAVPAEAAVAEAVEGTEQGTARFEVGVGPWEGPWPEGDHWDEELLREGDRRNVVDKYRYWSMDAIIADLDTRRHDFHVAIENWHGGTHCECDVGEGGPYYWASPLESSWCDGDGSLSACASSSDD